MNALQLVFGQRFLTGLKMHTYLKKELREWRMHLICSLFRGGIQTLRDGSILLPQQSYSIASTTLHYAMVVNPLKGFLWKEPIDHLKATIFLFLAVWVVTRRKTGVK